jgi:hypothetical protein
MVLTFDEDAEDEEAEDEEAEGSPGQTGRAPRSFPAIAVMGPKIVQVRRARRKIADAGPSRPHLGRLTAIQPRHSAPPSATSA